MTARDRKSPAVSRDMPGVLHGPCRRRFVLVDEIRLARAIEQFARNRGRNTAVMAQRGHLIEQIARMAGAQRPVHRRVMPPLEILDDYRMETEMTTPAVQLEDAREFVDGRIVDRNLV